MNSLLVTIEPLVLQKIMFWVKKAAPQEVSGFGKLLPSDNGAHVISAYLLKQENSTGSTEICEKALGRLMYETKDEPGDLNFWWHSHGNGGVFFSGTDHDTIQELGEKGFIVATVFNAHAAHRTSVYTQSPFPIFVDDVKFETASSTSQANEDLWEKEYDDKVKIETVRTYGYYGKGREMTKAEIKKYRKWMKGNKSWRPESHNEVNDEVVNEVLEEGRLLLPQGTVHTRQGEDGRLSPEDLERAYRGYYGD